MMRCAFRMVGDELDPDAVTRLTGVVPTQSWRRGDAHVARTGVTLKPRASSAWIYYTPTVFSVELPALLDDLLNMFEPKRDEVVALLNRAHSRAEFSLHIYMSDQTPIGTITHETLKRIVAFEADLDVDLYVVEDDFLAERAAAGNA
jgi:Domain of unknown function (DUF4279)